jgi:hypothetical protein
MEISKLEEMIIQLKSRGIKSVDIIDLGLGSINISGSEGKPNSVYPNEFYYHVFNEQSIENHADPMVEGKDFAMIKVEIEGMGLNFLDFNKYCESQLRFLVKITPIDNIPEWAGIEPDYEWEEVCISEVSHTNESINTNHIWWNPEFKFKSDEQ